MRALDSNTSVTTLLRLAKVVAVKLYLDDFLLWIDSEVRGYTEVELPLYRILKGKIRARNPYHGLSPDNFPNEEMATAAKTTRLHQKISEVEILSNSSEARLHVPLSTGTQRTLQNFFQEDMQFMLLFSPVCLVGIVDAVRNVILDWSLKLEKLGMIGDGMSFSQDVPSLWLSV